MFYMKVKSDDVYENKGRMYIESDNVYTRCLYCDKEIEVDLAEVFADGDIDLYATKIVCKECVEKEKELKARAKQIAKEARELFEGYIYKPSSLEEIENKVATKVEFLAKEFWNEILYREEKKLEEKKRLEEVLGIDENE